MTNKHNLFSSCASSALYWPNPTGAKPGELDVVCRDAQMKVEKAGEGVRRGAQKAGTEG